MTDNYVYRNGVLTIPTPPQPNSQAEENSKAVPPQAKSQTEKSKPAPHHPKSQADKSKTRINVYLDNDILKTLCDRAELTGKCYETLINETLRHSLSPDSGPLTIEIMRRILQEELSRHVKLSEETPHFIDSQYK